MPEKHFAKSMNRRTAAEKGWPRRQASTEVEQISGYSGTAQTSSRARKGSAPSTTTALPSPACTSSAALVLRLLTQGTFSPS